MSFETGTLVAAVSTIETVRAIGLSSSPISPSQLDAGDLDIFIYCEALPSVAERRAALACLGLAQDLALEVSAGGHWGHADTLLWRGIETWLMYFTLDETRHELEAVLAGKYPGRLDADFYPIGRCAMFEKMTSLYDPHGFIASLKERVRVYPDRLAQIILDYHLAGLEDTEDLERAVARKDVLFYHFALENALDHFLQALFACNHAYFPSRKRSLEYIRNFARKPPDCGDRLLQTIECGCRPETLSASKQAWDSLIGDFKSMARKV
jgi:hypothetical protein